MEKKMAFRILVQVQLKSYRQPAKKYGPSILSAIHQVA
jgi:hypothetical protein